MGIKSLFRAENVKVEVSGSQRYRRISIETEKQPIKLGISLKLVI